MKSGLTSALSSSRGGTVTNLFAKVRLLATVNQLTTLVKVTVQSLSKGRQKLVAAHEPHLRKQSGRRFSLSSGERAGFHPRCITAKRMARPSIFALVFLGSPLFAAEWKLDLSEVPAGQTPPGFRSAVSGVGKAGEWKIVLDETPSLFPPLSPQAQSNARRPVLAQLSQDPADEHFPLLIFEEEVFGDFTLTTRFKTVSGIKERMAGIAFRMQNPTNYYVARASSLGNTFRFYKVVNGERSQPIGAEIQIPSGVWHDLRIECKANQIRCLLNGKEALPILTDNTFSRGAVAFWTKSDSVSYFCDTKIVYTRHEIPAQTIVREVSKRYPRLVGLKIYVPAENAQATRLIASQNDKEIGQAGGQSENAVIHKSQVYYGKEKDSISVIMPLKDRNGEAIAAARVVMKPFSGQTEQNAIARALPVIKQVQARVQSMQDLID
jgi:hypothetical protein